MPDSPTNPVPDPYVCAECGCGRADHVVAVNGGCDTEDCPCPGFEPWGAAPVVEPEPRGTCGSWWCNGCDECQPEQAPMTTEQVFAGYDEDGNDTRCLPDCQGDCPVCLPPEEYDKLHGKTTNTATLSSVLHYEAGQADERARIEPELQRLRKERDDARNEVKTAELRGQMEAEARIKQIIEGRKKPHPCVWNEWMDELLVAIRGGDDA